MTDVVHGLELSVALLAAGHTEISPVQSGLAKATRLWRVFSYSHEGSSLDIALATDGV